MNKKEHVLQVYSEGTASEAPFDGVGEMFANAAKKNINLSFIYSEGTPELDQARSKVRHDLLGALRTLNMAQKSFEDGYKFDDDLADAKVAAIGKAVASLEMNIAPLLEVLD